MDLFSMQLVDQKTEVKADVLALRGGLVQSSAMSFCSTPFGLTSVVS